MNTTKNINPKFQTFDSRDTQDSSKNLSDRKEQKLVITQLNMETFKIEPCHLEQPHQHKMCIFYHNEKDRKRAGDFYSTDICPSIEANKRCARGDFCTKAHNKVEQMFRPEKYKRKYCQYFPDLISNCSYGAFCCFAHNDEEIQIELIHTYKFDIDFFMFHYKTIWCPFNLINHDKSDCIYAHNWQDFRRRPDSNEYEPVACENWNMKATINSYEKDGCPKGLSCKKCHGWKELEYHPNIYRTKQCTPEKNCNNRTNCSYFHNFYEKL